MKNRTFRLLLGLFFALDGLLFIGKAIRRGEALYWVGGPVLLVAAAMLLASFWLEKAKNNR
jgi:hypothetical protein